MSTPTGKVAPKRTASPKTSDEQATAAPEPKRSRSKKPAAEQVSASPAPKRSAPKKPAAEKAPDTPAPKRNAPKKPAAEKALDIPASERSAPENPAAEQVNTSPAPKRAAPKKPAAERTKKAPVAQKSAKPAAAAPPKPKSRKRKDGPSLDEILEMLPTMQWPMRAPQFQALLGINRTTAVMRLNSLVKQGHLREVGKREFGLPNVKYGLIRRPGRDSLESVVKRMPDLSWPMNRREFHAEIVAPANTKKEIIDSLMERGLLRQLDKSEFVYEFLDVRNPENLRLRTDFPPLDYLQLLRRMPERFTNAMFRSLIPGYDPKHTATTLNRLKEQGIIQNFVHGMYAQTFTELPLNFGLGTFALHFGMPAVEAAEFLYELTKAGKVAVHIVERHDDVENVALRPEVHYTVTPEVRDELEDLLHDQDVNVVMAENANIEASVAQAPKLPWPMTVPEYMRHYGIGRAAAWRSLNLLRFKGLVRLLPERRKGYTQYTYDPNAPMSLHESREREQAMPVPDTDDAQETPQVAEPAVDRAPAEAPSASGPTDPSPAADAQKPRRSRARATA